MENHNLRGRIVTMYGTIGAFAKEIGWSPRKVSYIVNKKQEPTGKEIERMAEALKIEIPDDVRNIFFT